MRIVRLAFAVISLGVSLTSLSCKQSALFSKADLTIINGAEPESIDPALATYQLEQRLIYGLFEGVTSFTPNGEIMPGVAERWEISPDGKTYKFYLRQNAYWSDGKQITGNDFIQSWKRALLPETASEQAYLMYYIKNAQAFNEGKLTDFDQVGIHLDNNNPFILDLELINPTPFFIYLTANSIYCPVPTETVEKWGDSWTKPEHIVTNGAFLLSNWRLNDQIFFTKNPKYWNADAVKVNSIKLLPINRPNTALNFYFGGLADLIIDKSMTPPSLIGALKEMPIFHSSPFLGSFFCRFNCSRRPFNDVRVRQAFCLAIDKSVITNKITQAGELPEFSIVPPGTGDYLPPPATLTYNPQRARELLAEAGYPNGKGFPSISWLYSESELSEAIGIEIKGMLQKNLGVTIGLRRQELKVYIRSMHNQDYDFGRSTWVGDYNDPNTFLDLWTKDGTNNYTGWFNPKYDELISDAAKEVDPGKRLKMLQEADDILTNQEVPVCPLYSFVGVLMFDENKIGGLAGNILDEHPFKALYRKEKIASPNGKDFVNR